MPARKHRAKLAQAGLGPPRMGYFFRSPKISYVDGLQLVRDRFHHVERDVLVCQFDAV